MEHTKEPDSEPKKKRQPGGSFLQQLLLTAVIVGVFLYFSSTFLDKKVDNELTISEVATEIIGGNVASIVVRGDKLEITLTDEEKTEKVSKKEREGSLSETLVNYGVTAEDLAGVVIDIKSENGAGFWLSQIIPFLFPLILIGLLIWFLMSQSGGGVRAFSFGQSRARIFAPDEQSVTFKDVAGAETAKQELLEIVEFLKNPKKFIDIGAKIPKGVLLMGLPGTGKTLLARAVAGEAGVPFFHLSGSEFVEMFVGVGASRVRDLFAQAKKIAPAIIFIDEIDAVGRSRGVGVGGGNDEREQTLNQILVEMDGFEPTQKVIVIAATNRTDVLDPALLRPGRFDRQVTLDIPDRKEREEILTIHARKKPFEDDVDLAIVAKQTPGFSGADLESLMNESAISAARQDKKKISQKDILDSIDKVLIGPERKSHLLGTFERTLTAYHEAGHAIVGSVIPGAGPIQKVSIVSRGSAGGYTLKDLEDERRIKSKSMYCAELAMMLGGYATEELIYGEVTTGPSNDLKVATGLARSMVTQWGMSEKFGPIALKGAKSPTMFGTGIERDDHSDETEKEIDEEIQKIIQSALDVARKTVREYRSALEAVAQALLEEETLEQDAYNEIIKKFGIEISTEKEA